MPRPCWSWSERSPERPRPARSGLEDALSEHPHLCDRLGDAVPFEDRELERPGEVGTGEAARAHTALGGNAIAGRVRVVADHRLEPVGRRDLDGVGPVTLAPRAGVGVLRA